VRVLIVGAGDIGYYLAKTLSASGHAVSVLEQDEQICESVAASMDVLVVRGDGSKMRDLADAGADQADVVAAVTGKDADNLVICQLAKRRFKVPRTIARVHNPRNEQVFRQLGVDVVVSSTSIIARSIEQRVTSEEVKAVLALERGNMFLVEVTVGSDSRVAYHAIQDLKEVLPEDGIIVSVIRGEQAIVPRGGTVLRPGDDVLVLTSDAGRRKVDMAFADAKNGGNSHGR
jgi:trk system potassium uptake protein TrkA